VAPDPTEDNAALAAYVPSFDDPGYFIRFAVQAINANGFSSVVWSAPGEHGVPNMNSAPTIASNGDGTGYDVDPGAWGSHASAYENVIYTCTDNTSTDDCTAVNEIDQIGSGTVEFTPKTAYDPGTFIRVQTFAMNDDSLSEGAFSEPILSQGSD
jgi:hypothetical protein